MKSSGAFPFNLSIDKKKGGGIYDKERIYSIYYNITPILSGIYFTSKIVKASDFTTK